MGLAPRAPARIIEGPWTTFPSAAPAPPRTAPAPRPQALPPCLVRAPGLPPLVDTCVGNDKDRGGRAPFHMMRTNFLEDLRAAGVPPESVDLVICTHLHVDHVGWNTR